MEPKALSNVQIMMLVSFNLALNFGWTALGVMAAPVFSSLGLSQTLVTVATISGPVTGLFQPFIGAYSDNWKGPSGRRRPFLLAGLLMVVLGMLLFGNTESSSPDTFLPVLLAISSLWLLNLGLNFIQICGMSLIMDLCPPFQLKQAMAMGSAFMGIAGVSANFFGFIDFQAVLPIFGSQHQGIFNLGLILVVLTMFPTCFIASLEPQTKPTSVHRTPSQVLIEMLKELKNITGPQFRIMLIFGLQNAAFYVWNLYFTDFMGKDVFLGDPVKGVHGEVGVFKYHEGVQFGSLTMGYMNAVNVVVSVLIPSLSTFLSFKQILFIAQITGMISFGGILFTRSQLYHTMLLSSFLGIFVAVSNSVPYTILGLLITEEKSGIYFGIMNIVCVLFQLLASFCTGLFNDYYISPEVRLIYGGVAPGIALGALWSLLVIPLLYNFSFQKN